MTKWSLAVGREAARQRFMKFGITPGNRAYFIVRRNTVSRRRTERLAFRIG